MQARDVMTREVVTTRPDMPVHKVAELMIKHHISGLPVLDNAGKLVGLVSEGDLLRRVEPEKSQKKSWWLSLIGDPDAAKDFVRTEGRHVSDVMTKKVITVAPETELREVAQKLEANRIKRLPVVENGKVVGIVSRANLLQGIAAHPSAAPALSPDDRDLREAVENAIESVPGVTITQQNVVVADGNVEIWGYVHDESQRDAIRVAAENVPGAKQVSLHVGRLPFGSYWV